MAFECEKCEYFNEDYIFDNETGDEFPFFSCDKGHDDELNSDCKCPYFEEYKPIKYVERDTKCDNCELLNDCISNGSVIDSTQSYDCKRHYMVGLGSACIKRGY